MKYLAYQILFILLGLLFFSCEDECEITHTYTFYEAQYQTLESVRAAVTSESPREMSSPGKIYYIGGYMYINETGQGIHVIDNRNPSNPTKVSFINIPGNYDLAAKGNVLYADSYVDLLTFDISNPAQPQFLKRQESVFGSYSSSFFTADPSQGVLTTFVEKEQVDFSNDCSFSGADVISRNNGFFLNDDASFDSPQAFASEASINVRSGGKTGVGGSTARFTVASNHLYTVDNALLRYFDLSDATSPEILGEINFDWGIETIFPYGDYLYLGSTTGMHIIDNTIPNTPEYLSTFAHVVSCDPVVVEGDLAYVTLRSGTNCRRGVDQLDIIDVSDKKSPKLIATYQMQNPHGLGIDDGTLFVCEQEFGMKVYNASDPMDIKLIKEYNDVRAVDVIPLGNTLMTLAQDGIYQYDYSDVNQIELLSVINIQGND